MHLAIVSPFPPSITGIGQYGYYVSRLLAQSGVFHRITVLTGTPKGISTQIDIPSPLRIEPAWRPNQWNTGWHIHSQLQRLKPDLVWFNLGASIFGRSPLANLSGFLSPGWARRLNIPTVITLHELVELADLGSLHAPGGPFAVYGARLLTHIGLQADVVCLTMRRYADWLAERQPDLRCMHIPIGAYHAPELLPESDSRQLLFFTSLAPFKGLEVLLEAYRLLQPGFPELRLTIAGTEHPRFPGYSQQLREQFKGLTGVHWAGQVPEEQVRELFRQAQIVALPYSASTGSSSVLYQAAMWGRSVVTSDLAETQAVVCESGLDVTYFERGNAASLAKALKIQIDSPVLRHTQIQHNFSAIQRNRPEETCRAYLQAFNIALETRRSPKRIAIPAQPGHARVAMIPSRIRWATGLAFVLQGVFILTARYRLSYDAYDHMFFGDHYRLDWWTLWEPRWYTGFEINSYPPLVHQLIGLFGHQIGVDAAFGLILWAVLTAYPLAVYAFSRVFVGKTVARYASLGAAVLPSIYQAAHTFGQLPTLTSGLFALFALAALNEFLIRGDKLSGALTISLFTIVMAAHHATLLFLPWIIIALLIHILLNKKPNWKTLLLRIGLIGVLSTAAALLVIWPFWVWGQTQTMQTTIDHPSRHNFFLDPFAPIAFFLPVYGPLIPLIPVILWKGFRRKTLGLWIAFLFLFVLGLGGTTPLPRWLFGPGWEWLTYDRFALWASLVMLPFVGEITVVIRRKFSFFSRWRALVVPIGLIILGLIAIISGLLATLLPTQPAQIDMQPIVQFLEKDNRTQWRYVTFGLGDQLAYLSRLTKATTIDGSYHTARSLPELRSSGIAQIDTTYWLPDGLSRLDPILQKSSEHGVRWGFINRPDYIPILQRNGWIYLTTLSNRIQVWENPQAILPPPFVPPTENPLEQFSWGVFPLCALSIAGAFTILRLNLLKGQKILYGIHAISVGLLPVGLCFWYYRTLIVINHPRVYFTYDNAIFYLSDALALTAFLSWALARIFGPADKRKPNTFPIYYRVSTWLFGLCLLASLSSLWSQDWRTSLFISLHLWLVFGLFLSLQDRPETWRTFALGSFAALFLQILIGFWQFGVQSTSFLKPLGLNWPGELFPAANGTSVVQLVNGERWLRVYGTLPHPNILGGLILVFLAGLTILFLNSSLGRVFILILFALGVVLLILTFSRSAWLGFATFLLVLVVFSRHFGRNRLLVLFLVTVISVSIAVIPLHDLIFTRYGNSVVKTETFSIDARTWLTQQGIEYFREHPFTGVGIGSFVIELSKRAGIGYIIEPVHNLPLLVVSELGLAGLILLCGFAWVIFWCSIHDQQVNVLLFFAILAGIFVVGLLDHYLWTLAPGRVLIGTLLGLWAAQVKKQ